MPKKKTSTSATGRSHKSRAKSSAFDVFEAADRAGFGGYFYFPQLTPTYQMPQVVRRTLMERSDWLYKNVGPISMVIDGLAADEVGAGLWPKWNTGAKDYDREMTDAFHYANHDPRVFSADGRSDFYCAQYNIRRMIRLYGDCFGQLLRAQPGQIFPRMLLLPGYLIDNDGSERSNDGWLDGVHEDSLGRADLFRVLKGERDNKSDDIPADDLLHFHDPFLPGQRRGWPVLTPVAKRLFRREEIRDLMANGALLREYLGFAIEYQPNATRGPTFTLPGADKTEKKTKDGGKFVIQKFFTGIGAKKDVSIPEMPPGATIKTVESNRPGTAVMEFNDSILREVALAAKRPPEYVFFLAGMGQGTVARLVLQAVKQQEIIAREFQLRPQFVNRWDNFWAWNAMIKPNRLKAKVPDNWWQHKLIFPLDKSVDIGREGRLYDERAETNKMALETYYGLQGEDREDVDESNLAVMQDRMDRLAVFNKKNGTAFGYFDMWPRGGSFQQVMTGAIADGVKKTIKTNSPNEPNNE